jgi:ubiquinone biosynthesis protein COQ4
MSKLLLSLKMFYSSLRFIKDPRRLEEVLEIAAKINDKREVGILVEFYKAMPEQAMALKSKPKFGPVDVDQLAKFPKGSLGKEYADFLISRGFKPDDITVANSQDMHGTDEEFVVNYFYKTHDLFHVVTGFGTEFTDELGLQAYYSATGPNTFGIFILALGLLNTFFFARQEKDVRLEAIAAGWRMGRQSSNLFGIDWEPLWAIPLTQVRVNLRLPSAGFVKA